MLSRRFFLKTLAATAAVSAIAHPKPGLATAAKPARLRPGAVVGLISPASATFVREDVEIVMDAVRGLGLIPRLAPHLFDRYGYLAGQDRDRAEDVNQFFADPEVAMLLPIRGGWGCSRMLPYLDYDLIRQNRKILVGFSDITALILGVSAQSGLVTFHGPNGLSGWRTAQTDFFRRVLFDAEKVTFENFRDGEDGDRLMQTRYRLQTITPGRAQGKLVGGNLSVISGIVGSPYMPDLEGAVLFLEDIGENIYRIDRMITHLKLAGVFDRLAGLIFGQCVNCLPDESYGSLTLEEVIGGHIQPLGIPAWHGATIGHLETILTLPIGLEVAIDADRGTIEMLEAAVV
ncbi:MAG: LD-carboxypeptidase [Leptolyngbyaceae cyanobacterium SM1_4_3]|nr:LD-carboxypeptidase [Leptolyngbyaceae cyanobacterium SM1_4_3]